MGGTSSGTTATVQQSQSQPWKPAIPALTDILGGLTSMAPTVGQVTPGQQSALNSLQSSAAGIPDYTGQATGLVGSLFGGGPDRTGLVNDAYSQYGKDLGAAGQGYQGAYNTYQGGLSPYLDPNYLDPTKVPGIQAALQTVSNDAYNKIAGSWAGAGRDPSGSTGAGQAIGRGIVQAEAPLLLNQYNQNVATQRGAQDALFGAGGNLANYKGTQAGNLFGAGGQTAGLLSGLDQTKFGNQVQANSLIPGLPGANAGANATLQAANYAKSLPLQNYADLINMILPIAGLGGQVNSSGSQNNSYTMSGAQQFATIAGGLGSLFAPRPSDRRVKRDIEQVGSLFDGTPVYRFRYIGDEAPNIGLMAQDVEQYAPEAVVEIGGIKHVDYWTATERAAGSA